MIWLFSKIVNIVLDNIKEWKIVSLLSLDEKNNQYALVHLIAVKLYDRYFLYVYQNLDDSLYQYPEILQLHHMIY
jgi:hypothetical protein